MKLQDDPFLPKRHQALFALYAVASTLYMTGVIWFVQIVHYPLMARVGGAQFREYSRLHQLQTTWVVAPAMLAAAVAAVTGFVLLP